MIQRAETNSPRTSWFKPIFGGDNGESGALSAIPFYLFRLFSQIFSCPLLPHICSHLSADVTCVWREKYKVHTGFLVLIYSNAAGFCPVIMCRREEGAKESFYQPAFRAKLGPRSGAIADSQGVDQRSFSYEPDRL